MKDPDEVNKIISDYEKTMAILMSQAVFLNSMNIPVSYCVKDKYFPFYHIGLFHGTILFSYTKTSLN